MTKSVCIALSLGASDAKGSAITLDGKILEFFDSDRLASLIDRSVKLVGKIINYCREKKLKPIGIGISTKGEVKNGIVKGLNLKKILEEKFKLRTEVLNRFHSMALGISYLTNTPDCAVINIGDGVGFGVIESGKIIESYSKEKGAGGLRIIKRHSDQLPFTIAGIAGANALKLRANKSISEIFSTSQQLIIDDAAYAIADLINDIEKNFGSKIFYLVIYDRDRLKLSDREFFLKLVKDKLKHHFDLRIIGGEVSAKLIGASRILLDRMGDLVQLDRISLSKIFVISGEPGSGKSTLVNSIYEELKTKFRIGGMITSEIRENGKRTGFSVRMISNSEESEPFELAKIREHNFDSNIYKAFKSYQINIKNIKNFIVPTLSEALEKSDLLIIDEVGSMQLFSPEFESIIQKIIQSNLPLIITVPIFSNNPLINELKKNQLFIIDRSHREKSQDEIKHNILAKIKN